MKSLKTLFWLILLAVSASAQVRGLVVREVDGSPRGTGITEIVVSNTTLTINGQRAIITTGGGGGSGITVGTTTVTGGTATRLFYETAGNVVGQISGVTSDGTNVTFGSGNLLATSPAFTTNQTTTNNSIGTTSTDGIVLQNTTAAAAGAQQYSPRLRLTGQGWKTNATAASQTVDWAIENRPVQGAANPTSAIHFLSQVNGGGYASRANIDTVGTLTANFITASNSITANTNLIALTDVYIGNTTGPRWGSSGAGTFFAKNNGNTAGANIVVGPSTASVGASGVAVIAMMNGTAPSSRPADEFQFYAADYAAGDSRANILSENNATPVTIGNHSVLTGYQHLTKTADYTVVIADSNVFFDNAGAGAGVVFTLPTPTASPSLKYTFCRVANQTMTVDIGGSVTIRSGANVTTSGGNITLDAVGTCLTIYSVSSTEWYASAQNGTLTFN